MARVNGNKVRTLVDKVKVGTYLSMKDYHSDVEQLADLALDLVKRVEYLEQKKL